MAISRPFLLALIGIALLAATAFAVQSSRNGFSESPAPAAEQGQPQPAQSGSQPSGELSPQQTLDAAFGSDVKSAKFEAKLSFSGSGESGSLAISGAAQQVGGVPEASLDVKVDAGRRTLDAGFVATGGKAWLLKDGVGHQVPADAWKAVLASADEGESTPAALPFDPSNWAKDLKSEGSETIDGVETEHISAALDPAAALADISKLAEQGAGAQGAALPPGALDEVEQALKRADFDVYVGKDDKLLRRLTADIVIAAPGSGAAKLAFELTLSDVNEPQTITAPAKVSDDPPGGLFGRFAQGFSQGIALTTGADASTLDLSVPTTNAHLKAERAVKRDRKVVIFFENPRGLDDRAVAASIRALKRNTAKVVVLTDHVRNVDEYGSLVEDLGVNQAPSIVVINRRGDARLIEGYIDAKTLAQVVADAR